MISRSWERILIVWRQEEGAQPAVSPLPRFQQTLGKAWTVPGAWGVANQAPHYLLVDVDYNLETSS